MSDLFSSSTTMVHFFESWAYLLEERLSDFSSCPCLSMISSLISIGRAAFGFLLDLFRAISRVYLLCKGFNELGMSRRFPSFGAVMLKS